MKLDAQFFQDLNGQYYVVHILVYIFTNQSYSKELNEEWEDDRRLTRQRQQLVLPEYIAKRAFVVQIVSTQMI